MSARNIARIFVAAGISGDPLDLPENAILKFIPQLNTNELHVGSSSIGMDFQVNLGGTSYFRVDAGANQVQVVNSTLSVTGSSFNVVGLTASGTIQAATVNATTSTISTLNLAGSFTLGNITADSVISNTSVNAASMTVIPATDDTGTIQFGNTTRSGDVTIFLGGASTYVRFDRGDSTMYLRGTTLDTNSSMSVSGNLTTTGTLTANIVNTTSMNVTGAIEFTGNGRVKPKTFTLNTNVTLNSDHFDSIIFSGVNNTLTLPNPTGNEGEQITFINVTTSNTTIQAVNATSQKIGIVGDSAINTVKITAFGNAMIATSVGTDWVVSPLEGTTLTTT